MKLRAAVLVSSLLASSQVACRSTTTAPCRAGEVLSATESLYFGTATPSGMVTAEQWQSFLAEVITPRFPAGLTAWSAAGQWRDAKGELQRESSYVLSVIHPDTPEQEQAVQEIVRQYKAKFQQEAVLRVRSRTCVSF